MWHVTVTCGHKIIFASLSSVEFTSVTQSCLTVCDPMGCSTPASLSITNSWSLLKLTSIQLVMPSNHLIFWQPLLYLSSIFPSIRIFSNESVLPIRWPKYWSFSFSISLPNANILLRIFVSMFINEFACNFLFMCDNFFGFDIKVMMA